MAKRTVYICDGKDCGAVLVHPEDGFIITGVIRPITLEGEAVPQVVALTGSQPDLVPETSLCRECMALALNLKP